MPDAHPHALHPLGWSERVAALLADLDLAGCVPGRVVRVDRSSCVVATGDGDRTATAAALPAVGDWVVVDDGDEGAAVRAVAPRWSQLTRRGPSGGVQVLAANVDVVLVTTPADRIRAARVERELALSWQSGARPVVVVTKADLVPAGSSTIDELRRRLVGADLVLVSGTTGAGVDRVADELRPDRTAVLLGPSGAGKSTLANALLGEARLATGAVRSTDRRGRHTTTTRQLLVVPGGGTIVDTPGLRSLGLAGDDPGDGVEAAFADVAALAAGCRFGDCGHAEEPGCAVLAAVAAGALDARRLASYRKLQQEAADEVRRADPRAGTEHSRAWRAITREQRARPPRGRR